MFLFYFKHRCCVYGLWYCTFCARPLCIYTRRSPNTNHTYILYTYLPLTPLISQRVMRLLNKRQTKSISNETKAQNKQPSLSVSQNNLQCHNNKETKMKLASSSCFWVYVCVWVRACTLSLVDEYLSFSFRSALLCCAAGSLAVLLFVCITSFYYHFLLLFCFDFQLKVDNENEEEGEKEWNIHNTQGKK